MVNPNQVTVDPNYDFSGYITKYGMKCSDGRTIKPGAFAHQNGSVVPLVWQHNHSSPTNILGKVIIESRPDGEYGYGYFNNSEDGVAGKAAVEHKDIESLSIYANELNESNKLVSRGQIREVSLVLHGANPGAHIDYLAIQHADGGVELSDEDALMFFHDPIDLTHADATTESATDESELTVEDVIKSMSPIQQKVAFALIGQASEGSTESNTEEVSHSDSNPETPGDITVKQNVFDKSTAHDNKLPVLSHSDFKTLADMAPKYGGSLKEAFIAHAATYGIDNIGILFPNAQSVMSEPEFIKRNTEWVSVFFGGARKTPFSRIKSAHADITADEARARGYVTAALKVEEVFGLTSRETTPTTIYKKQKLDRDNIVDITDLNVVSFLKGEMRMMLDEEIARAGLVGDGRTLPNPDKIDETKIRPIYKDDPFYAPRVVAPANTTPANLIKEIIRARKQYKRSGNPIMFTTTDILTDMLLIEDAQGYPVYKTKAELAARLRVADIVEVEVLENVSRISGADTIDLKAILVNPRDYTYGADKGGEIALFDDFDIDYNQYKYLMETRCSGCLVYYHSALIIEQIHAGA